MNVKRVMTVTACAACAVAGPLPAASAAPEPTALAAQGCRVDIPIFKPFLVPEGSDAKILNQTFTCVKGQWVLKPKTSSTGRD
ncbi:MULTISPECIES: hypothetical protein [Actinomadura]|uniref:Uncharacterized protein n=1 Tax=Actinomadura yumaensis TaxID=111807 RepID=A0ABW2CFP4_9ACTN|nr:hypothetical protein [Actinomadura sp. J1-007]MWK35542.1 hypothetical protein [Actinomadura sp. J1-007]